MAKEDPKLSVSPKSGSPKTSFNFTGENYKDGVLVIDFGDGTETSITVVNGKFSIDFSYAADGEYAVQTNYVGDSTSIDSVTVKVS